MDLEPKRHRKYQIQVDLDLENHLNSVELSVMYPSSSPPWIGAQCLFVKYIAKVSAFVRALTTLPCSSLSFNDLAVYSILVLLIQTTTATRGVGGSGEALKSRRSGEATSAAVSDHVSKSHSKSLEVARLLLGPPSRNRRNTVISSTFGRKCNFT